MGPGGRCTPSSTCRARTRRPIVRGWLTPRDEVRGNPKDLRLADTAPAIETVDLTKHFGPIVAVDHLTFTVNRGEIFGFLGPNGSGKSTTMRMLLGLARPTRGSARFLGMDIHTRLPEILRRAGSWYFWPVLSRGLLALPPRSSD